MSTPTTNLIRQGDQAMSSTSTRLVPLVAARPTESKAYSWLSSRRGTLVIAAAVAGIGAVTSGWYWLGFAVIAPVIYLLPCAAMMAFCMKGMGKGEGQCSGKQAVSQAPGGGNTRSQT